VIQVGPIWARRDKVKITVERALTLLKQDIYKNLPFIRFMEDKESREIWQSGDSLMALINGTVYISCQHLADLDYLLTMLTEQDIFFAALDPELAPAIIAVKGSPTYQDVLGKYILPIDAPLPQPKHQVVPLPVEYAPLVDEHWTLSSHDEGSLGYVKSRLEHGPTAAVFKDGDLIGWCATHSDHAPGFIYVHENYRNQGIASDLTISIVQQQRAQGYPSCISIADSNEKSKAVAEKLGFKKSGHLIWMGFE
jgi:GNAT superfamily N-acetyltransferase